MKEVVYDFEEFKAKVDLSKPIHHSAWVKVVDQYGVVRQLEFKIFGISESRGNIVVFEVRELFQGFGKEGNQKAKEIYEKFVEKYAKPLGSTEGRWEP